MEICLKMLGKKLSAAFGINTLRLVICTNTLAEGVNLPIRTLVLHTLKRYGGEGRPYVDIMARDIKNIVGRAGRAGKALRGLVVSTNPADFDKMKQVIENRGSEKVKGYLFAVTKVINDYICEHKVTLSNDFINEQNEEFLALIDKIDASLLSLIDENAEAKTVDQLIEKLAESTFAFHQATQEQKILLKRLLTLRGDDLKQFINAGELVLLKAGGGAPRLYKGIKAAINYETAPLVERDALSASVVDFYFGILSSLPQLKHTLDTFNKQNKTNVTIELLKHATTGWIAGKWFSELAQELKLDVRVVLKVFSRLIQYEVQLVIASISKIVLANARAKTLEVGPAISLWPEFIQYGVRDELMITLIDLGFTDRFSALSIGNHLLKAGYMGRNTRDVRRHLIENSESVLGAIRESLPTVVLEEIEENFEYLRNSNML